MKERLFWGLVCVVSLLATVAVCLLGLWAGLKAGVMVVKKSSLYFENAPGWISEFIPDELLQNAGEFVSVTPSAIVVAAIMTGAVPTWSAQFGTSAFRSLIDEVKKLWHAKRPGSSRPPSGTVLLSLIKPGVSVFCAAFLLGTIGSFGNESRPPATYVFPSDSTLNVLPIHPVVHFENAEINSFVEPFELTDRGTTLNDAQKESLKEFVQKLRQCATSERPVTITLYGFASDDLFVISGVDKTKSNKLNVEVANRRAGAVYDALTEFISELIEPKEPGGMTVEAPAKWNTFEEMVGTRNSMIHFPEGTDRDRDRDPLADRVVVLHPTSLGTCRSVD